MSAKAGADPAKQPLRSEEGVVIESVKTVAPSNKADVWHIIFNERRPLDVFREKSPSSYRGGSSFPVEIPIHEAMS